MKKYIITFSIAYALAMVAVAAIESFFDLPGGSSITCLIVGGFAAASSFVKDHQRVPNKLEKRTLIWSCILASVLISVVATVICLLIFPETQAFIQMALTQLPAWVWLLAISFTLFIHYLMLALSFGWMTKSFLKAKRS